MPNATISEKNTERAVILFFSAALAILLVMLELFLPKTSGADEFKLIPSAGVREEYNDNIFTTVENTVDDFITTITAGLELIERTERLDINLTGKVSPFYFSDHRDLNDVDQNYWGEGSYQISQLVRIGANARYDVSNRPDRDIETTGLVESNDRRRQQEYGLKFEYTITETTAMGIIFSYLEETWDSINLDSQNLETYGAVLNLTKNLGYWIDPTIGRLNFGYGRYKFETSDTFNYYTTLGAQHWFSEKTNLLVDLGVRYTDGNFYVPQLVFTPPSSFQVQIAKNNNKSFGGIGSAILEKRNELMVGNIKVSHDISPASGRGTTVQRSGVVINVRRKFAEKSVIAAATGYFWNRGESGEFSFREINEDTFFIQPSIRWEFINDFTLEASYNFTYVDRHLEDESKVRNLVYLQIAYRMPLF